MKTTDIAIGKTYRNRGAGTTTRTVMDIGEHVPPPFTWSVQRVKNVRYFQPSRGCEDSLSLMSFAQWAGSEVKPDDNKTTS